jgi:hypothetical protein
MMRMTVKVYEYSTGESFEVCVGGYNHTGSGGLWYNTFAHIISDPDTNRNFTVRYGYDGAKSCIWIGETNSSWSYPKVSVVDFQAGHSYANEATWATGWSVGFVTSFGTVQRSHANNEVGIDGYEKRIGGVTVIDSSRNLTNIANVSESGGGSKILKTASNGYLQLSNWINIGSSGLYSTTTNGAHFYPTTSTYGAWRIDGSRSGWTGIWLSYSNVNTGMYDSSGNGGDYSTAATGGWHYYYHRGNRCLGVAGSSTSSSYGIYEQGGGIFSTGNITAYSDRRKKENIITVDNALEKVNNLRGVYYNRIDDEEKKRQVGVIAQETEKVLPEAVTYSVDVDEYGVSYGNMAGVFIEAIKELTNQVKELKQEIEELKNGTNSN